MFSRRWLAGFLCVLVMVPALTGVSWAHDGWAVNPSNGHHYTVVTTASPVTWYQARDMAIAMGGYLVTITSQQEQDFLVATFPEILLGRWWIGAFQDNANPDADPAGEWQWVTGEPWSYTNWFPNEPNDNVGIEDVGMIWHDGYWNDCVGSCDSRGFIVEHDPEAPPPGLTSGFTRGFWGNNNGNAILDPGRDGDIDSPVTIGGGDRKVTVTTIATNNIIVSGKACGPIITCDGNNPGEGLSPKLHKGTLNNLLAQTLALSYNIKHVSGFSGQQIQQFGAPAALIQKLGLSGSSTVGDALALANSLIAGSTHDGGTTQTRAAAMNELLGDYLNPGA